MPAAKPEPKTWGERLAALRNVPPLLALVWKTSPPLAATGLTLRLIWAILPVGTLWVSKLIIDRVVSALSGKNGNSGEIWLLLGIELALVVLSDLLMRGAALSDSLLGDRFTNYISLRLMEHASRLDLAHFEDPAFYDKLERARRQTTARLGMLGQISGLLQASITLLSVSAVVVSFSWLFLAMLLLALLPVFWSETRFAVLAYSLLYRLTPERRELDYLRMLGASNNSAKEVKIFGLGPFLTNRSRELFERFYAENRKLSTRKAITGALLNLLPTAGYFAAYALILSRTMRGELTVGDLTFLTAAFLRSRSAMESIFNNLSSVSEQALYITDLFDFFATEPSIQSKPNALPAPRPIRTGFEFRNVSFAYPEGGKKVLNNISFHLHPQQKIALIGENGAGKTTLVKLLARLYDPTEGQILLDGIDLREYSVEDLRREVGVIFQDYMRYDMKAKENIGVGRIEELTNRPRIEDSARKSLADTVIIQLDGGFDRMLGRRFEGGAELSAGQWQKVALGRAYMRDAQVLILDEPTASLDARAEFEVFRRFTDLTQGKIAVLISHRFSTVRMADRILVLENGGVKEQGSHEELLALGGRYAELFELQAAGYR